MKEPKLNTGMYIIDRNYRILSVNEAMSELYPSVKAGDLCYRSLALQDSPCQVCPLEMDNALFYNPLRKEWISANAAAMDHPGIGECYHVQFQIRQRIADVGQEAMQEENMDEHIMELSGGTLDACAIGGFCEPGSPISYVNNNLLNLLGYSSAKELYQVMDGLVLNTIHPDDVDRVTRDLTRCALQGGTFESTYRMRRKDQSWFWIVSRGKRVEMRSGAFVLLAVITDMTEFVKRQEKLQQQNEALVRNQLTSQAVLEHMPGGYHRCAAAPGFPFLYFGASFEAITGWSRQEIETEFGNLFANMVLPEDLPLCTGIITEIEKSGYSNAIYRLKKKGGGHIWVSDATMRVDIDGDSFYQGVLADVTPQIQELEAARREAENSSRAKTTFLFNASHDFRTPLNAIQGFAHYIKDNAYDAQKVLTAVHKLQQSSEVLLTLVNDVLELSRIERGKETINLQPLDMVRHTEKLYEMIAQDMAASGIEFFMENDIHHPVVMADDLKLSRMAMNLLSNARKFTPAGGKVTFGVRETDYDGKTAIYSLFVNDTGIGMSQEFQERAFEQFERERTSTDSGISGSGLGLSITKKIVDLVGGTCTIKSELGKGTCITCSVPLQVTAPISLQPEIAEISVDYSGMRILLVEDNEFNREVGRYVFEALGFLVEEAENGVGCLEMLTHAPAEYYDFILMDIQMPVMDGYTATQEIRRLPDPVLSRIPIIAMTANAFAEDRKRCLDIGMDGHIGKPLESKAVIKEFTRVLHLS